MFGLASITVISRQSTKKRDWRNAGPEEGSVVVPYDSLEPRTLSVQNPQFPNPASAACRVMIWRAGSLMWRMAAHVAPAALSESGNTKLASLR